MSAALRQVALSSPWLDEREEELVLDVLRSGRLSLGPTIDRFEELFAEAVGAPYAAAVSSGTAGLHLLSVAAGIKPGDEVITSPYSFNRLGQLRDLRRGDARLRGRRPSPWNLDPAAVEARITPAHEGDRGGRHLRLPERAGRSAKARTGASWS